MGWKINEDEPDKLEPYKWHSENDSEQAQTQTQSIGDLKIKPSNLTLKPGELQIPAERVWDITDEPDDGWYIYGQITEEF